MLMETGLKTSKIEMVEAGLVVVNMYNSTFSHSVLVACRLQFTVSLSVSVKVGLNFIVFDLYRFLFYALTGYYETMQQADTVCSL